MSDFLLEIGLEEVPARMMAGAEAELGRRVSDLLRRERLLAPEANPEANSVAKVTTYSTPRRLAVLAEPRVLSCPADLPQNDLAELFDKYNLHALPVVDAQGRMVGVVQADHVISFLRDKL